MSPAELAKHCALGAPPSGMEYSEALTKLAQSHVALHNALDALVVAVESLDDIILTRDAPQHEAQVVWDDAIETANKVLGAVSA